MESLGEVLKQWPVGNKMSDKPDSFKRSYWSIRS